MYYIEKCSKWDAEFKEYILSIFCKMNRILRHMVSLTLVWSKVCALLLGKEENYICPTFDADQILSHSVKCYWGWTETTSPLCTYSMRFMQETWNCVQQYILTELSKYKYLLLILVIWLFYDAVWTATVMKCQMEDNNELEGMSEEMVCDWND
jgi:hypothetical protein